MFRRIAFSTAVVLLSATPAFAQRQAPPPRETTELTVRVSYEDDRPVGSQMIRVQLTNQSGVPVADTFTNPEGEARFPGLDPGVYRLRVTGMDIEEKNSERSFSINPREMIHMENIQVRRKPDKNEPTSTQGSISSAALNVPSKAQSEYEKGLKALRKPDPEEAKRRFSRAAELYPRYAAAFNNLGVIAMQQGNPEEGLRLFREALQADDQYMPPYLNLAKIVAGKKDYLEAEQLLLKATSIDPNNVEILALLAMIEYQGNEMPMALANARRVHELPNHERFAFAHYIVGRVLESQHQDQEALVEYRLFLKESPTSPTAENVRGFIAALEQKR